MRPLIYVVEDDPAVSNLIRIHLENAGDGVSVFTAAEPALQRAPQDHPVLVILDVMLPGMGGFEACKRFKRIPGLADTQVLIVSARTGEDDRIAGLDAGADDYISKPFSPRELMARVRAALRRTSSVNGDAKPFTLGELTLDPNSMCLRVRGQEMKCTAVEFRILEALLRAPGRVFSREQLLDATGAAARDVSPRSIDVYIRRLRRKLERNPDDPEYIQTVRQAGYRLVVPKPAAGS